MELAINDSRGTKRWGFQIDGNVVVFLLGLVVTSLLGYFSFRLEMRSFQKDVQGNSEQIKKLQEQVRKLQTKRENLRIDVNRVELKINALMQKEGLNPKDYEGPR